MVLFKCVRFSLLLLACDIFTFHYGPIQITLLLPYKEFLLLFTFHYGPIQINIYSIHDLNYKYIYIPLWSYSNELINLFKTGISSFTFHYGPIQMHRLQLLYLRIYHLHSTMVLFKSCCNLYLQVCNQIYIPLWSYSNLALSFFNCELRYLHSTMVLFK